VEIHGEEGSQKGSEEGGCEESGPEEKEKINCFTNASMQLH